MLELAARNDGWVNFLLTVAAHGIVQMDAVTRHWNGTSWDSPGRDEFAPTSIKRTYVAEDASTHTPLQGTTADPAAIKAFASEPPENGGCNYTVDISQNMNTPLFEMHNASSHTTEFSYGWTADSDIDIAVKPKAHDWSVGSEFHVGNSTSVIHGWVAPEAVTNSKHALSTFTWELISLWTPRVCIHDDGNWDT